MEYIEGMCGMFYALPNSISYLGRGKMAKIMGLVVVLMGILVVPVFAEDTPITTLEQPSANVAAPVALRSPCPPSAEREIVARQGCCSWHDGVCGCSYGRVVCCDGSYSPSCTCNHDDAVDEDKAKR